MLPVTNSMTVLLAVPAEKSGGPCQEAKEGRDPGHWRWG